MKKAAVIDIKKYDIETLKRELKTLEKLELGRMYKIPFPSYESNNLLWGFIETFNTESFRFRVVASETESYYFSDDNRGRYRNNIISLEYGMEGMWSIKRVKRSELMLLIGLKFTSSILGDIIKGKKRVKLEED